MPRTTATDAPARLAWADVAKGGCILLVVLHHVVTKQYVDLVPLVYQPIGDAWAGLSHGLKPVRMPLFFVLSGFFASTAVTRPWAMVARGRIWSPAYLYVVWLVLLALFFSVERELPLNRTQDLGEFALDLVFASTGLWFLYALVLYFVLAKLAARVPIGFLLGVAATVSAGASLLPIEEVNRVAILVHFVHFVVGARCPDLLRRLAADPRPLGWPLALALVVGAVVIELLGAPLSVEILVISVVGVPWGLRVAAGAARMPRLADGLAWVGRRTLPIYVMHVPVLAAVHHLGLTPDAPDGVGGVAAVAFVVAYPLLVAALVVGGCLVIRAALLRVGLRPLFELPGAPRPVRQELERVTVSA